MEAVMVMLVSPQPLALVFFKMTIFPLSSLPLPQQNYPQPPQLQHTTIPKNQTHTSITTSSVCTIKTKNAANAMLVMPMDKAHHPTNT